MADNASYNKCRNRKEDSIHILRDCSKARQVSNLLSFENPGAKNCSNNLTPRILDNITDHKSCLNSNNLSWSVLFISGIWNIWLARNARRRTLSLAKEINITGEIKINIDGCCKGNPGNEGFGDIFRNHERNWVKDFHGHLTHCTGLGAELKRMRAGLVLAKEHGLEYLMLKIDFEIAIKLIEDKERYHPLKALINNCIKLLEMNKGRLKAPLVGKFG